MILRAPLLCLSVFVLVSGGLLPRPVDAAGAGVPAQHKSRADLQELMRKQIEQQQEVLRQQQAQLQQQQEQLAEQAQQIKALQQAGKPKAAANVEATKKNAKKEVMPARIKSPKTTGPTIPLNSNLKEDDARKRGAMRLPGTRLSFKIGGYIKADVLHDIGNPGDEDTFISSTIPVDGGAEDRRGETRFLARQSRLNVDLRRPDTPLGTFHTFLEGDFFGTTGNQRISNSDGFRLRHAYAELGNLLVGQTWTTFMDADALPATLDFEGPGGQSFIRQAQVRWTQPFTDKFSVAFALENPEGDFFDGPGGAGDRTNADGENFNSDVYPDTIVRARYIDDWGHLQAAALFRELTADDDDGFDDSTFGYGVNVAGVVNTPLTGDKDNLQFQINYGDGIGRYILDLAGFGYDAVVTPDSTRLKTLKAAGGYIAYQHWWLDNLRSTAVYSRADLDSEPFQLPETLDSTQYGALNLIWSPVPQVNVGVEALYGRRKNVNGDSGDAGRIITSGQFFF